MSALSGNELHEEEEEELTQVIENPNRIALKAQEASRRQEITPGSAILE